MASGPRQPEHDDEESTLADEEWPVAEQYRVESQPRTPAEHDDAIVIQQGVASEPPVRRFPPDIGPGLVLALLGVLLIVLLVPAGIWLAGRDDDDAVASPTTASLDTAPPTTTPETPADGTAPDVTGLTLAEARARLEQEGVQLRFRRIESDEPVDRVLKQVPEPGARMQADTVVVLTVSGAAVPTQVTIPSVEGLQERDALSMLERAGLEVDVRTVTSTEPEGVVVSQTPGPDEKVAPQSVVVVEVSKPPPPAPVPMIAVPRLVDLTSAEARRQLRDLGLRFTQRPVESDRAKGTVVEQSPRAGARLRKGQAVTLTVSTGPARVAVPDVVGLEEQAARNELTAAGFEVEVTEQDTDLPDEDGVVVDQDPAAAASRPKGSVVTITIGLFG